MDAKSFAVELRKWWSFDDRQMHTHSWHSREDFIAKKLPELLRGAVPIDQWRIVVDEPVLIYVVHINAEFEKDEKIRREKWENWTVGRWIKHNTGGWTYYGMMGTVTHVAPLPTAP